MNARPSIGRLTAVELRKMADTRAGFWLLATTGLISGAVVTLLLIFADAGDLTFATMFTVTLLPAGLLLPVLGILSTTSEWTQRTALVTYALAPVRERVAAAKLLAAVLLAALSVASSLIFAAAGNLLAVVFADGDGSWHITATTIPYAVLFQVINVVMGYAFGALLMSSPLAIVLYFLLPLVWSFLGGLVRALQKPARWLDTGVTMEPLIDEQVAGPHWARLATSVAVWVLLPLVAGLVRLSRREIS